MTYVYGEVGVLQRIWMPSQLNHCLPLFQWWDGCEWMTNPSVCLCTRSLKTLREKSTRQISRPWPRLPPRMGLRSTSFPSPRSPCLSPNSLADPVRNYTILSTHNPSKLYLSGLLMTCFWVLLDLLSSSLLSCFMMFLITSLLSSLVLHISVFSINCQPFKRECLPHLQRQLKRGCYFSGV